MGHKPPIPERLSPEGKDFLSHCLESEPRMRWTASQLLDHSFVKVCTDEEWSWSVCGLVVCVLGKFPLSLLYVIFTWLCWGAVEAFLTFQDRRLHRWRGSLLLLLVCVTWRGASEWRCSRVKKLHVECHYYCARTVASAALFLVWPRTVTSVWCFWPC